MSLCKDIIERNTGKKYVPFIPIEADGYHINTFGGANIVYIWCKGQMPDLFKHIYKKSCHNPVAEFLVSSEKYHETVLSASKLELAAALEGNMSNMSMMMYIYRKIDFQSGQELVVGDRNHTKIETAFRKIASFKCTRRSKKSKNKIY